ncbi:prolyl oligopeptidase family serine peptidase [Corynebacterium uropygiale]|uniref:Prolyl oligopeptidase family serine peptidase n=1 Tax=Corynebacterium uropygiale TaxID=1775911 RepID=A0A9X1QQA9_9CORY|nr:prolyl oligopeptidase family serine peptidase [Corynebacterium uropygiale]MCF4005788.1 prolyl oligopeptidase family serine peptidase [Corynebacterium uropygiale]
MTALPFSHDATSRAAIDPEELIPVLGESALAWAQEWTQATDAACSTPEREELRSRLIEILGSKEQLVTVSRRGEYLYNLWKDSEEHPRGLWRRTLASDFLAGEPAWEVLLDLDALSAEEGESWVWKGGSVERTGGRRALLFLSRGGADATVVREFDCEERRFLRPEEGAFVLPEAKSSVGWIDEDRVLLATDHGEGSLTDSGYPRRIQLWERGHSPAEAPVIMECPAQSVGAHAWLDDTATPPRLLFLESVDMFRTRLWIGPVGASVAESTRIPVPEDCGVVVHGEHLLLMPRTEATSGLSAGVPAGGLGVVPLEEALREPESARVRVLVSPDERTSLESVLTTQNYLLIGLSRDVSSRLLVVDLREPEAAPTEVTLPEHSHAIPYASSPRDGDEAWIFLHSFAQPPRLLRLDPSEDTEPRCYGEAPAAFDATGVETRQHWATSADGTRIPYFITGRFDGEAHPTFVGGYGGFEVSLLPSYLGILGTSLLEKGWYIVQPSLRGGGEFGPEWHQQVVKKNRTKVYEDHRAVIEDLHARGYATPALTAVRGGSNGGLLTAQALTQYPELLGAAVIQVPLTDMLRYHRWLAGASWMCEYGDPDVPEERAVLESYSPLHHVVDRSERPYPPALVTTSTRDDRVHPAHARLFARALAAAGQPVDYAENTEGGHAGAADYAQVAAVESLIATWLLGVLSGHDD